MNLAVVGVDDARAHCLTSGQVVDGATGGVTLVAKTFKVGTLYCVSDNATVNSDKRRPYVSKVE